METYKLSTTFLVCFVFSGSLVSSYPTGAPTGACTSLNPDSHGPSTAKDPSPYKLSFSSSTYKPGDVIKVTLSGAMFKGFLIVGRKEGDVSMANVGFFQSPSSSDAQLLCTTGKDGNGMTHTNNTVKSTITLAWKAPSESMGNIEFHYTVVRGGAPSVKVDPADYFMDLKSAPLKPASDYSDQVLQFKQVGRANNN
ncbi:ferric-chelate reductase 1 [Plakobranchus ocellatus]|uniref:Ferric-chelate reductase 1 n=1 Tax=Plakobranchus ocellatus TaxID=259542 RepID=A0AAV3XU77_9GAST|nr:ferric-chelate reductase 1 [Plakobranchus ocellatus]